MPLLLRVANARTRIQTRRGTIAVSKEDTVIPYVQTHIAPGEPFLVYPYLPLYNYLTDTVSPSRYEYFQPGMSTPEQARDIVGALSSQHLEVVLFEADFWGKIPGAWPETPLAAIARDPVAEYIQREYRDCKSLNSPEEEHFLFMVRKDLKCP